jgi:hypothetical protein
VYKVEVKKMVTELQKRQMARQIGHKYGFSPESISIGQIRNDPRDIKLDNGRILVRVPFLQRIIKYTGEELFSIRPSDLRKMPMMVEQKEHGI